MAKTKKKSKFSGKVGADSKRQKTAASSYGYLSLPKGLEVWSPDPGSKTKFDIIPYLVNNPKHPDRNEELDIATVGELWYKRPFKIHRNVGVKKTSVVCLTSFGKRCPICDYWNKRKKEGAEKEELDSMKPSLRNLYVIMIKGNKKATGKPQLWDVSQHLFQVKLNEELEEREEFEAFPDLEKGFTLSVRFISKTIGGSKPFAEASRIDFEEREEQYDESLLEDVPDLDSLLIELSSKELEVKFFELPPDNEDEDEEESRKKPAKKSAKKEEEEDEDEDDDSPKRSRKSASPKKPIKKEDEDEEDEDEEEDTPPKKDKKSAPTPAKKLTKKPVDDDEDDDDDEEEEEEDEDDEEEEEEAPRGKKQIAPAEKGRGPRSLDPVLCAACKGTGKNSRGKTCPICDGTGMKPDKDSFYNIDDD